MIPIIRSLFFFLLYLVGVFSLPWWAFLFFALILIAYLRAYVVAIIGALMFDALYGSPTGPFSFGGITFLYTMVVLALVVLALLLRGRLLE